MLDILIHNGIVITMKGYGLGIIENGAIGIKGNRIEVVDESSKVKESFTAHKYIDADKKVVMPGLIDSHIHSSLALLRGLSQDIDDWMEKGLWPFVEELDDKDIQLGSMVNIIEGVKAGTTTFCDYNSTMDLILKNHAEIGTRVRAAETINELPDNLSNNNTGDLYTFDPEVGKAKLKRAIELFDKWHKQEDGRITCVFGPQGPDMLSRDLLLKVKELAEDYDSKIHIHLAQGEREHNQMLKRYGKRSIPFLNDLDYLDERVIAVHLTVANPEEVKMLAESNASMILCSGSIGIIDGIIPPLAEFLKYSDRAGLGSDQAPGNNCNNMFNEMKFTSILNKCRAQDPSVFPAGKTLRLATIEGARAIGLEHEVGSLEKGKKADIIFIDFNHPNLCPIVQKPIRNIVPNLVYSARGHEVETVIIDGNIIMEGRELKTVEEEKYVMQAHKAAVKLTERAEGNIDSENSLLNMMKDGML